MGHRGTTATERGWWAVYARSTTLTADLSQPGRLDEGISYVRDEVMPAVTALDGCVGLSMIVERESGRCIVTAAWRDQDAMRASDATVGPQRERAAQLLGGTPTVDVWEIAVLHRAQTAAHGECVRVTWTQADTDRVDRVVGNYRDTILPAMEELAGFRSASLFIDRATGRAVSSVSYADRQTMDANRSAAAGLRRSAVAENDIRVLEVAECDLVLAHLRVPELV